VTVVTVQTTFSKGSSFASSCDSFRAYGFDTQATAAAREQARFASMVPGQPVACHRLTTWQLSLPVTVRYSNARLTSFPAMISVAIGVRNLLGYTWSNSRVPSANPRSLVDQMN